MVKSNKKSYTIIEILIVTAIIVVLSGTSLVLLSSYRDDKTLNNQVLIFSHTLELAKNKAIAGDVSLCGNNSTSYVDGYSVGVNMSTSTVELLPACNTVPSPQTYPIPTNIVYVTPTFSVRFGNQNYEGGTRIFPIKNLNTNTCKFVQIDETGLVTNGDITCP